MIEHLFRLEIKRRAELVPIDAGTITFHGQDYETFDESAALQALMPGGDGPETLDVSLPGFIRWRGVLLPASDFEQLTVTLVSKTR